MAQVTDIFSNIGKGNLIRSQTFVSLASQFGLTAIGFLSTVYFTRLVDPALVGIYFLFFSYYTLFYLFSESGIGEASVKIISEGHQQNSYYSASMTLRLIYLVLCIICLAFMAIFFPSAVLMNVSIFWWVIAALIIDFIYNSRIYAAYADGKVNAFQVSLFLNTAVRSFIQIIFVYLGYHTFGLEGGFFAGMIAAALFVHRYNSLKLIRFSKKQLQHLLKYAVLVFLVMSCYLVYQNIDVVMIGHFMSETHAGIYRIIYQFSMLAGLATISMKAVLYPKFSAWNEKKEIKSITEGLRGGTTVSLMLAIPIFFSFLILGHDFIFLFYGNTYTDGVTALYWLSLIQIVTVFMYLQGMCLNAISHPKYAFLSIAAGIVSNIILNLLLIPNYGMEGAAIATTISMSINVVLAFILLKKSIQVHYDWKSAAKMIIVSLVMCGFLILFKQFLPITNVALLLIAFTVGGLLYGFIMLIVDKNVRNEVFGMARTFGIKIPKDW
ncbi:MAG: flippase [Methanimicrococcus sp.]|nr:flippase [Methanimicrococcus sp.]